VNKPKKRGRQRTVEQIEAKLVEIGTQMATASPMDKLLLASQEVALEGELAAKKAEGAPVDLSELEAGFIKHGKVYAENKGIPYEAWRVVHVPPKVLRTAVIPTLGTTIGSFGRTRSVGPRR
jgi:hypothetical protein